MNTLLNFEQAVTHIGLDARNLRLEGFRTDGTSNYLANLNYRGQTWAAALRMPARGAHIEEFVAEKTNALQAVSYLLQQIGDGIPVGLDCALKFAGVSTLVDSASTQDYLRQQHSAFALRLVDKIGGREKRVQGLEYPELLGEDAKEYVATYGGPFYISRGAPAWETLEDYPDLECHAAHALAALHLRTGSGSSVPRSSAVDALEKVQEKLLQEADKWVPSEGSKEANALAKALTKWRGSGDAQRSRMIKRERYIRTAAGRKTYTDLFKTCLSAYIGNEWLRSFSHGDSHGGNYIIVRYQYVLSAEDMLIDRVFLNEIFEADPSLLQVYVAIDEANGQMTFSRASPESGCPHLIATRSLHHEIHPIDLDAGQGISDETKVLHLFDALLFSISLQNLTTLFASAVSAKDILMHYYDGLAE